MSPESRTPARTLRRAAPEPHRSVWAASLGADLSSLSDGAGHRTSQEEPSPEAAAVAVAVADAPASEPAETPASEAAGETSPAPVAAAVEDRSSLQPVLEELLGFDGSIGVALVDGQSGMVLGEAGSASNLGLSAAGASVILRARLETKKTLGRAEEIVDVLITLSSQVQIIHPLSKNSNLFLYLIGDKARSSLAMARYKAAEADANIRL